MEAVDFADTIDRLCDEFRERLVDAYDECHHGYPGRSPKVSQALSAATNSRPVSRVNTEGSSPPSSISGLSAIKRNHSTSVQSITRAVWSEAQGEQMISMTSSDVENENIPHGDSSVLFQSVLASFTPEEARTVRHRLRWRLGAMSTKTLVSGKLIHDAVSTLGLTTYSEEDMNDFVNLLADFIKLSFDGAQVCSCLSSNCWASGLSKPGCAHSRWLQGWPWPGDSDRPVWKRIRFKGRGEIDPLSFATFA